MTKKKINTNEDFSSTEATWQVSMETRPASPDEPEDYGTVFSEIPFQMRWRFGIVNPGAPVVTIYSDVWVHRQRQWVQQTADSYSFATLKRLMPLLDKELKNND